MGKLWEHAINVTILLGLVFIKGLSEEMDKQKYNPEEEIKETMKPVMDKIFTRYSEDSSSSKKDK